MITAQERERLEKRAAKLAAQVEQLREAIGKLLDSLPPDFPNRAYYNEITASTQAEP